MKESVSYSPSQQSVSSRRSYPFNTPRLQGIARQLAGSVRTVSWVSDPFMSMSIKSKTATWRMMVDQYSIYLIFLFLAQSLKTTTQILALSGSDFTYQFSLLMFFRSISAYFHLVLESIIFIIILAGLFFILFLFFSQFFYGHWQMHWGKRHLIWKADICLKTLTWKRKVLELLMEISVYNLHIHF